MKNLLLIFFLFPLSVFATEFSRWDASLYWGPSLSQSGNTVELGKPNFNTIIELNYYMSHNHGIGASVGNEFGFDSSSKFPANDSFSMHLFEIHYAWRFRPEGFPIQFSASPGFGQQSLYGTDELSALSTTWAFDYKLMADFIINEMDLGKYMFLGLGITQIFSFKDEYQGQDITGDRLSLLLRLGAAF
jgi:hypothetical protein